MAFEPSLSIAVLARVIKAEALLRQKQFVLQREKKRCCRKIPNQFVPIDRLIVLRKARDVRPWHLSKPIPIAREDLFP